MDEYAKGVQVFHQAKKLDTLMEFLARYVRKVHADKFLKRKLIEEPGVPSWTSSVQATSHMLSVW